MTPPPPEGRHRPVPAPRRPDASMGLLTEVVDRALEPDYVEVAARAPVPRPPAVRAVRAASHLLLAAVLGVLTAVAAVELRAPRTDTPSPRALLEREIEERSAQASTLTRTAEEISAEIAALQADVLQTVDPNLLEQIQRAELVSGARAVSGPGLVIELEDGPDAAEDEEARVQDADLHVVVNGLWSAGAEAIAINGRRLTSLSAVRSVGPAIQVDLTPVLPPYRVEALGDPQTMQTAFARSTAANHLAFLTGTYDIRATTSAATSLELPGAGGRTLRHATVLADDVASSSPEEGGSP